MRHFVMFDLSKGINIIKHNFLKRFCNVGHSGTVLHATGSYARNMPANNNYNNYRKKICRKMVSVVVLGTWNLEILQKQNAAI